MSSLTTWYKLVKPFLSEEVNAFTLAYNIQLMSYVIYNLKQMTNPNPSLSVLVKSASAITFTSTDYRPPSSSSKWVDSWPNWAAKYLVNTDEVASTSTTYQFVTDNAGGFVAPLIPGYYRITYQVHVTMSDSTQNHGTLRAALAYAGDWDKLIPKTFMQVPLNTQSVNTTLTFEDIIKVVEQNYKGTDYDMVVHGDNSFTYWTTSANIGSPDRKFGLMVGQWNDAGLTASISGDSTYFTFEFLRGL